MALASSLRRFLLRGSVFASSPSSASTSWSLPKSTSPFAVNRWSSSFPFGDDEDSDKNLPPLTTPKLFVSGLSRFTTDEKLKEAFSPFGQLFEAKVITDKVSGRSKGFGFVRYATIEEADKARRGMNAKFLDGWVIFVDPAKPREPKPHSPPDTESSENGIERYKVNAVFKGEMVDHKH